ncbi:MAG: sulfite exporter TauE/SafE family protein [Oscillospiraceae bacterium]|nr:sulfite exporter TauE/SafE family protein [Oscillospiraceae bacterium]
MSFVISAAAGLITGIISAWGVGGGTVLMVYMTTVAKVPQTAARSTNLLYFLPTSLTAVYWHIKNRYVDWGCAIPAAAAGVISATLTAYLAAGIDSGVMRRIFGGFLIAVGITELLKK